jgi:hypothetical protein
MSSAFEAPPRVRRPDGAIRRVGVEIEFAGPTLDTAARIVRDLYGGRVERRNRFACVVRETRFGDFAVEIDSKVLKEQRWERKLEHMGAGARLLHAVDDVLETLARAWIPCEIASPPIALDRLHEIEPLREALRVAGAKGTHASPLYAFGFQLNPELPADDATTILRHLQAYVVTSAWLEETARIDRTRRILPFVDPFPEAWRSRVLAHDEAPTIDAIIDEYVAFNPTRNRPLDMLPAFAWLRPDRVLGHVRDPDRIHPRPAFHYRLPNSCVDDARWSFAAEWNRWVRVERLADDEDALRRALHCAREEMRR